MVRRFELDKVIVIGDKIDVSQIGPADARIIGLDWYELLENFYSNPENEENFQEWLKKNKA